MKRLRERPIAGLERASSMTEEGERRGGWKGGELNSQREFYCFQSAAAQEAESRDSSVPPFVVAGGAQLQCVRASPAHTVVQLSVCPSPFLSPDLLCVAACSLSE